MSIKAVAILVVVLLCITPSLALLKYDTLNNNVLKHYSNLNESVKAILGSVLDRIDRINFSDSSDDTESDDADDAYNLLDFFAEPEEKIKRPAKLEDLFNEAFGKDNRFFEELMEMVARALEKLHDHDNKFIDVSSNDTKSLEALKENVLESFKDFHGLITKILDNILDDTVKVDDEEYIVSDKKVNRPVSKDNKEEKKETKEGSGKEEIDVESKEKLKDGLKTINFIKSRLGNRYFGLGDERRHEHGHGRKGDKVLRRQNAMKPSDFEKYLKEDKENSSPDDISDWKRWFKL